MVEGARRDSTIPFSFPWPAWTRPTAMDFHAGGRMATRWLAGNMPAAAMVQGRQTGRLLNASPARPCKTDHPFVACCNKHKG